MAQDPTIKKQLYRARKHAADNLRGVGYGVIVTDGGTFDLVGVRDSDARFVRVALGRKSVDQFMAACRAYATPPNCHREIWLCKNGRTFEIIPIH